MFTRCSACRRRSREISSSVQGNGANSPSRKDERFFRGAFRGSTFLLLHHCKLLLAPWRNEVVRRHRDVPAFLGEFFCSFADKKLAATTPPAAHDELQHWLRRVYREFRELDLRILLADLQSAIQLEL